jgi:hypothetical protein
MNGKWKTNVGAYDRKEKSMKREILCVGMSVLAVLAYTSPSYGQRGAGESVGMARQATRPPLVAIEGTLTAIKTGPCERTTGRAGVGTHLLLQNSEGKAINVHLGPATVVASFVNGLKTGDQMTVKAFRTDRLPADHYVAVKVTVGEKSVTLRDETLRPTWAGQQGSGRGPGFGRNQGYGPGPMRGGRGPGRGFGCWRPAPEVSAATK